jgi:dTDP-4-dehydrorhamnose reductase
MQTPESKPLVWVTGAAGLIGSHVVRAAPASVRVMPLTRQQLDIADFDAVKARFSQERPSVVIHCAAIAKANDCETHPHLAWRVNSDATKLLADLSEAVPFYFISTDLVFDGRKGNYTESDTPNPLTVYGKTKAAAERAVLANPRHTVLRAALNGGTSPTGDRSFTEQLIKMWRIGRAPTLFTDEFRSPTTASVTARVIWELVAANATGIFHAGGAERMSRYEAGCILAALFPELRPRIARGSLRDYKCPSRPADASLDSSKLRTLLSFPLPSFRDSAREFVSAVEPPLTAASR